MSSILDALKKLEADKAARLAQEEDTADEEAPAPAHAAPYTPEPEPAPAAPQSHNLVGVSPRMIIAGIAIFAVCLVAVSVTVSLMVTQRVAPAQVANVAPPAPVVAAAPPPEPPAEEAEPETTIPDPPMEVVVLETPAAVVPEVPKPQPVPKPAPTAPAVVAPTAPQETPTPVSADTEIPLVKDMEPVDIDGLTPLRTTERIRYGLENMKINMLREPNASRPNGLAVINLVKFYIGEVITGTRARLIGVEGHGIAIEMIDNGERYYVAY